MFAGDRREGAKRKGGKTDRRRAEEEYFKSDLANKELTKL